MAPNSEAVQHTKALWNSTACGELEGDKNSLDYFYLVKKGRYLIQDWAHQYFRYDDFSKKKVLEIGIGQGTDLMEFAQAGAECSGIDVTENHLNLTKRNFELNKLNVNLVYGSATNMPFPDNHFDCIYSFGVLHHIPEIDAVLLEADRVLKPGGALMIALYYRYSAFHLFCKILFDGIYHGWLFTKGYAGLLATIERGADGVNIKPYVRLYSKRGVARLMKNFAIEDISVHQLKPDDFGSPLLGRLLTRFIPALQPWLGWYVTCKARARPEEARSIPAGD